MTWTHAAPILDAIAWPIAIVIIVIALSEPLGKLAQSLGTRVTALGIGKFSIELDAAKADAFSVDWQVGAADARKLTSSAIFDSASTNLFDQIARSRPADYSIIDLEDGESWLASRLFIFALVMGQLDGARVFVFVESKGWQRQVYVGHASLDVVREVLGRAFPWFEVAYEHSTNREPTVAKLANFRPEYRSLENAGLDRIAHIVESFVRNLQRTPADEGVFKPDEWLEFTDSEGAIRYERTEWLNAARVQRLFGSHLHRQFFMDDPERTEIQRAASVIARQGDFVASVDAQERLQGLVDRRELLRHLAPQVAQTMREG